MRQLKRLEEGRGTWWRAFSRYNYLSINLDGAGTVFNTCISANQSSLPPPVKTTWLYHSPCFGLLKPFWKIAKHFDKSKADVLSTDYNLIKFLSN